MHLDELHIYLKNKNKKNAALHLDRYVSTCLRLLPDLTLHSLSRLPPLVFSVSYRCTMFSARQNQSILSSVWRALAVLERERSSTTCACFAHLGFSAELPNFAHFLLRNLRCISSHFIFPSVWNKMITDRISIVPMGVEAENLLIQWDNIYPILIFNVFQCLSLKSEPSNLLS